MPYIKPVSASSICFVRYRKRGSGLTLNGLSFSLKKLLYMAVGCLAPFLRLSSFSSAPQFVSRCSLQSEWVRMPLEIYGHDILREARVASGSRADRRICLLNLRGIRQRKIDIPPDRPIQPSASKIAAVIAALNASLGCQGSILCISEVSVNSPHACQVSRCAKRDLIRIRTDQDPASSAAGMEIAQGKASILKGARQVHPATGRHCLRLVSN